MPHAAKPVLSEAQAALLRGIPSLDELLARPRLAALAARVERSLLVDVARAVLGDVRARIAGETATATLAMEPGRLEAAIAEQVERVLASSLVPVINATGVILHTNLGRAPLAGSAIEPLSRTATQYSNLEYDLEAGARGKRDTHITDLLVRLTGAEAAVAVNNGAAAVLLVLAALAKNAEVLVSRGELIEIGDGFRIPEILAESGATLREVGTTNRTRLADYENAISQNTRLLLRVHPSNFRITGFTEKPALEDLAALSSRTGIPLVEDLGSGCVLNLSARGITEPTVRESIAAGVGLVTFSGDKLLGGPQAGIIAGKKDLVQRVRRHPLFRALRIDKLTTAVLAATLGAYLRGAVDEIPALRMILATHQELGARCAGFLKELRPLLPTGEVDIDIAEGASVAGGGSTPSQEIPTPLLRFVSARHSPVEIERRLRRGAHIPVIARIEEGRLIIDLRTVFLEQEPQLREALAAALR
jgi:L-seryl-tRNA(Ser) seleniumtransferase